MKRLWFIAGFALGVIVNKAMQYLRQEKQTETDDIGIVTDIETRKQYIVYKAINGEWYCYEICRGLSPAQDFPPKVVVQTGKKEWEIRDLRDTQPIKVRQW